VKPSKETSADIGIGMLVLLIARSLAEVFRLEHMSHGQVTLRETKPFVLGALIAVIALGASLIARRVGSPSTSTATCAATIGALFVYRLRVIDPVLRSSPALGFSESSSVE
jgi:hypothetical protein